MSKLVSVILMCGLIILLYIGIFQNGLGQSILDKGTEVETVISGG